MNVNVSLQVIPIIEDQKIYEVVDQVIQLIKNSGCSYQVGPMETTMEGELGRLLQLVAEAQEICVRAGAQRVISVVKIDYKPGGVTIEEKINKYKQEI